MYRLGGEEYTLRPAFGVVDKFEDRFGSIFEHLDLLQQGRAKMVPRASLILFAYEEEAGSSAWTVQTVAERMYERGLWHEDTVLKEIELVEKLLYTPEQYTEKKRKREEQASEEDSALLQALQSFSQSPP